jgi:hypothetical protein
VGNDNTLTCESEEGDVDCEQHITNIINILSIGGGANVTCSNNASAGGHGWVCHQVAPVKHDDNEKPAEHKPAHEDEADCPEHAKPAHVAPAKHHAAPAAHHRAAVHHAAQPKGQLAYTGAEVSFPLTLGLLALGAGGALTLAGRRRSSTAAV